MPTGQSHQPGGPPAVAGVSIQLRHSHNTSLGRNVVLGIATILLLGASPVHATVCDQTHDVCFAGIGDLPGGNFYSEAKGIAHVDGVVVVVGESSSAQSQASGNLRNEACKYSGEILRRIIDAVAPQAISTATDVALVGTQTFVTGSAFGGAMRAVQTGDELVVPQILPAPPGGGATAIGNSISDDGLTIVGNGAAVAGSGYGAFRWTQSGGSTALPILNPNAFKPSNFGNGVSPSGFYSTGGSSGTSFFEGFVFPRPSQTVCIPSPCPSIGTGDLTGGEEYSTMFAVANSGVAVGFGHTAAGREVFRWIPASQIPVRPAQRIALGDLPGGTTFAEAYGVAGDGSIIVGGGTSGTGPEAFIWHTNLGMRSLRELLVEDFGVTGLTGWTLQRANAISTDGLAIAGTGRNPSAQTEGWFLTLPDCNGNGRWDGLEAPIPSARTSRSIVQFDGVDDFLELATPSPELLITGNLTIEAWVFLHRLGVTQSVITLGEVGEDLTTNVLYSVEVDAGGDIVVTHERADLSDAIVVADTNLHTGRWYHLAVTRTLFSLSTLEYGIQIDRLEPVGFAVGGRPAGGTAGRLRVGRAPGTAPDRPFDGYIADIRIWNTVRTPAEITGSMFSTQPLDAGSLVASWPLDEPDGASLADVVGSNDLTVGAGGFRLAVAADCNQNRIPDSCEVDCNENGVPDDCDLLDGESRDCDFNGRPDECDTEDALAVLLNQDKASTEVFRAERDDPNSPTTFGTMIQRYGRPWKPGTGQTPGAGVCFGGSDDGLACSDSNDCPGGSCVPPAGTGATRDPAERLRMLTRDPQCLPTNIAENALAELFAFEMLLGNEAFADALDPTVGEGALGETISLEQVPGLFAFQGLPSAPSLLAEELALLRGREIALPASSDDPLIDDPPTNANGNYPQFGAAARTAVYNRLRPNATDTAGSLAYRSNYGFTNTTSNAIASEAFPQGHGDAFGYYLTATKVYLRIFGASQSPPVSTDLSRRFIESQVVPRANENCGSLDCEHVLDDDGVLHHVGFKSVRNMAVAMAARARTASRAVDLTFRQEYREDIDTRLTDTDAARAWGIVGWARRGSLGAYLDWAALNHLLPVPQPETALEIEAVHRGRVDEVGMLASAVNEMQERVDAAGAGLNPLGLVPNVIPFRIIQPGQLLNFLEGGSGAGKSHYGIVRDAALEAIRNARGILKRANMSLNRLRDNEESFADFEDHVRESDVGLNDRLIEIFGLPSPSDITDNDFEDNDGDGVQMTGAVNDPDDDEIESGCNNECAGSPDLRSFFVDSQAAEELGWAERPALGQIQLAMFEFRAAVLRVQIAEQSLSSLEALIQAKAENVALTHNEQVEELEIQAQGCNDRFRVVDRKEQLAKIRENRGFFSRALGFIGGAAACVGGGLACGELLTEVFNGAREALANVAAGTDPISDLEDNFDIEREELRINCWQTASLTRISNDQSIRALEIELEDLIRKTPQAVLELAVSEIQARQALAVVNKNFQEGKRLVDERDRIRRVQSDKLQDFRYRDLAFRTFRNQALEQFGAFFDLANRYVMLAARAFAYEYNERDEVNDQMRRLHRERLLGTETATDQGLESVIARLDQKRQESDFSSRLQKLSLFDQNGDEFSLRKNLLGLAIDPAQDTNAQQLAKNKAFRALMETSIVQELLDVPAFAQLASIDSDRDSGPALVLTFSTEVAGRTLFGKRRGTTFGAPANFDTCSNPKIFEFAILLEGIDNPGALGVDGPLVFAHFLPVGSSMLRAPTTGDCSLREVRTWAIVDQRIPGVSAAYRDSGGAILDAFNIPRFATSEALYLINRFPVTQAQLRQTENPVFQDDLAGWSVWNTEWMLAIPGRQFTDPSDDSDLVRRKLLILIYDADESGNPRSPDANLGIDDIKLRIKAYGKPS